MIETDRLRLPFLAPGQVQKELIHNEALQVLDFLVHAIVEEAQTADPPKRAVPGSCYIVAPKAAGDWLGHDKALACATNNGWRFIEPFEGLSAMCRADGSTGVFLDGVWRFGDMCGSQVMIDGQQVVGKRYEAIATPKGGKIADEEARITLSIVLEALRHHGLIESCSS